MTTGDFGGTQDQVAIFGSEYDTAASDGESTTTSGSFVEKLTFTTASLPAGDYRIGWSAELANSSTAGSTNIQVDLDSGTIVGSGTMGNPDTAGEFQMLSGHIRLTLTAATHQIDIDFSANAATASIRRARIEIWRAS